MVVAMNPDVISISCFSATTLIYGAREYRRTQNPFDLVQMVFSSLGLILAVIRAIGVVGP